MDTVMLTPDLERFATDSVAAVVCAGVELLRQRDVARAALLDSVLAAQEEGDRDGYLTGDEVAARVRATIARRRATPA